MWKRLGLLGLAAALLAGAWSTGLLDELSVDALRQRVAAAGMWGPLLFVVLFGLEGLGVPGILFLLTAVALWPPWLAFLLNWAGAVLAAVVGFAFARGVGRDWVARRLPPTLRRFEKRVVERSLETVILFRLFFFIAPWAHWALGLSPVGFRPFLLGTAIGLLPAILAVSFFGAGLLRWLEDQPAELWLGLLAVAAAVALLARARRRRRLAHEAVEVVESRDGMV